MMGGSLYEKAVRICHKIDVDHSAKSVCGKGLGHGTKSRCSMGKVTPARSKEVAGRN
jgi:hypothetical protein